MLLQPQPSCLEAYLEALPLPIARRVSQITELSADTYLEQCYSDLKILIHMMCGATESVPNHWNYGRPEVIGVD